MTTDHNDEELHTIAELAARGEPLCDADVKRLGESWLNIASDMDGMELRVKRVEGVAARNETRTLEALDLLRRTGLL